MRFEKSRRPWNLNFSFIRKVLLEDKFTFKYIALYVWNVFYPNISFDSIFQCRILLERMNITAAIKTGDRCELRFLRLLRVVVSFKSWFQSEFQSDLDISCRLFLTIDASSSIPFISLFFDRLFHFLFGNTSTSFLPRLLFSGKQTSMEIVSFSLNSILLLANYDIYWLYLYEIIFLQCISL